MRALNELDNSQQENVEPVEHSSENSETKSEVLLELAEENNLGNLADDETPSLASELTEVREKIRLDMAKMESQAENIKELNKDFNSEEKVENVLTENNSVINSENNSKSEWHLESKQEEVWAAPFVLEEKKSEARIDPVKQSKSGFWSRLSQLCCAAKQVEKEDSENEENLGVVKGI